jgi:hypothetical protein
LGTNDNSFQLVKLPPSIGAKFSAPNKLVIMNYQDRDCGNDGSIDCSENYCYKFSKSIDRYSQYSYSDLHRSSLLTTSNRSLQGDLDRLQAIVNHQDCTLAMSSSHWQECSPL